MRYFPICVDLFNRSVLLVGSGEAAARKARLFVRAGAALTVIAPPPLHDQLSRLGVEPTIEILSRNFSVDDVSGRALVCSATGVREIDRFVAAAARAAGVPVNVVDQPKLSTFIMPAIVDRDSVTIGISTSGAAPMLARMIRDRVERLLPAGLGQAVAFAKKHRIAFNHVTRSGTLRRRFWEGLFEDVLTDAPPSTEKNELYERLLGAAGGAGRPGEPTGGVVYLVGAGPGDPDLLTLRALRVMQHADVILYDHLVSCEVLERARREAEWVAVGKSKGCHTCSQDEINALMAERARAGQMVVRLKGGDPLLFGRGAEELNYLRARGIRVEVIPGITAALACSASAGISLTDRRKASAVTFITGHSKNGEPDLDWASLTRARQTLVVYMGIATAALIAQRLIENGLNPATPVAVIQNGTRPDQRVITGEVANLGSIVRDNAVSAPAVLIIGSVVQYRPAKNVV